LTITKKRDIIILSKGNTGQAEKGEKMIEMTEKEMQKIKLATLYELRLIFTQGNKDNYTTEEIVELLDKLATAKE
jgi:hypothetical protein